METTRLAPDSKTITAPLQSSIVLHLRFLHLLCEDHQSSTQVCMRWTCGCSQFSYEPEEKIPNSIPSHSGCAVLSMPIYVLISSSAASIETLVVHLLAVHFMWWLVIFFGFS